MDNTNPPDRRPFRGLAQRMTRRGAHTSINSTTTTSSKADTSTSVGEPSGDTTFECNICFDIPRDPVVTPCGHLYCWSCLYRWIRLHADSPQCPVCKAGVDKRTVIPIYGRGRLQTSDPRERPLPEDDDVPPRPSGRRNAPLHQRLHPNAPYGVHHTLGINAHPGNYEFSFSNFGLIPSIFGLQVAYPPVNEPPHAERRDHQEENLPELGKSFFYHVHVFSNDRFFVIPCAD